VAETLRHVGGNKTRAAEMLGLDRKTLYRKLEECREAGLLEGKISYCNNAPHTS
jgi:DNA-binding protein Fis